MTNRTTIATMCALGVSMQCLAATYTITVKLGDNTSVESSQTKASGASCTIPLTANSRYVYVTVDDNSCDYGRFAFSGTMPTAGIRLVFGDTFRSTDVPPDLVGRDWAGLVAPVPVAIEFYGGIGGDFGYYTDGSYGGDWTLYVQKLVRFDVGGTLWGWIGCDQPTSNGFCVIEAGTISAQCQITVGHDPGAGPAMDLTRVKTTASSGSGSLKCGILVKNGNIDEINSAGRITGYSQASYPTTIRTPNGKIKKIHAEGVIDQYDATSSNSIIQARDGIDIIEAASVDAKIDAAAFGGSGVLKRVVTASSGLTPDARLHAATVVTSNAGDLIDIKGDLDGDIIVAGDMNGTIRLGHSITNAGSITMGAGGLRGQIIINGEVAGGTWSASNIVVGTTALAHPYYSNSESSLGGGAVGLVPYHLHAADCAPAHDDTWGSDIPPATSPLLNSLFSQEAQSVRIRFYGPVYTNAPGGLDGECVTLWYWITRSQQWQDVTDAATVTLARSPGAAWSRDITLTGNGAHLPPGFYAVVARTDPADSLRLICNGTTAATPPSPGANMGALVQYNFRLWADCDNTGEIDPGDLGARTTARGWESPMGAWTSTTCCST